MPEQIYLSDKIEELVEKVLEKHIHRPIAIDELCVWIAEHLNLSTHQIMNFPQMQVRKKIWKLIRENKVDMDEGLKINWKKTTKEDK